MVLTRTVPVGHQKLKVTDVIGYERAPLACGEDEKIFIWRFPHPHLLYRYDIVPFLAQLSGYFGVDVLIEEKAHRFRP